MKLDGGKALARVKPCPMMPYHAKATAAHSASCPNRTRPARRKARCWAIKPTAASRLAGIAREYRVHTSAAPYSDAGRTAALMFDQAKHPEGFEAKRDQQADTLRDLVFGKQEAAKSSQRKERKRQRGKSQDLDPGSDAEAATQADERVHFEPLVCGMHEPEASKGPQGLANALVRGASSFQGDQQAHAEERQAIEEIDA